MPVVICIASSVSLVRDVQDLVMSRLIYSSATLDRTTCCVHRLKSPDSSLPSHPGVWNRSLVPRRREYHAVSRVPDILIYTHFLIEISRHGESDVAVFRRRSLELGQVLTTISAQIRRVL